MQLNLIDTNHVVNFLYIVIKVDGSQNTEIFQLELYCLEAMTVIIENCIRGSSSVSDNTQAQNHGCLS